MKDRRDYQRAIEIIGEVIRAWDPYCLIAEGAPSDEFDDQIAKITAKVPTFLSSSDAAQVISSVFSASFRPDTFSASDCAGPAETIFTRLGHANLLSAA